MDIVQRARNICLTPNTEWPVIAQESTPASTLITDYVVPLAAIGAVAGLIGGSIIGTTLPFIGTFRTPLLTGVVFAVFTFVMAIVGVFILSLIINALAPTFAAEQNSAQALKVAVYSYTPAWIAAALRIFPVLGVLAILGGLYGLYLLYLGLPRLMKCPAEKAVGYTVVVVVCAIVLSMVVAAAGTIIVGGAAVGAGLLSDSATGRSRSRDVQFDKNSALGKLQDLGDKLEQSNKKMESAQKAGDQKAEVAAAMESLGTLLGGGKRVDPIAIDQLKPFVPETFAGLAKKSSNVEKTGMAGIMVSKAEAIYGDDGGHHAKLEITDTGGVSGMLGLANWMNMEGEKDDDSGSERTQKINGRLVHEKASKRGGDNEFALVLGDRFVVSATGTVTVNQLKAALSDLDLAKLESMKSIGVQK